MRSDLVKVSKFLSYVLRHAPDSIDHALDANGWASIDELMAKAAAKGTRLDLDAIREQAEGIVFYRSENGVWLTAAVPARFLSIPAP